MSAGKAAAQCSHATLGAYRRAVRRCPKAVRAWLRIGQMKITLKCPSLEARLPVARGAAALQPRVAQ
jgi:peptidyl-tRNA hydrolase